MSTPAAPVSDTRAELVLRSALRVLAPLVRWLLRHGVTYPRLAAALKGVFLDAARDELAARGMAATDSAITLLCGVHRRDVRQLTRAAAPAHARAVQAGAAPGLVGEVVGRWMSDPAWLDRRGRPRVLPRGDEGFDALVAGVSRDVRARALLDEMLRLGVAEEGDAGVRLRAEGFAPRAGLPEMAGLLADNLHDHAAAAVANLEGEANFLEQAIYVDRLTAASAERVRLAGQRAWQQAFKAVMREAQAAFDDDEAHADADSRTERARFGVYFYRERERSS